MAIDRTVGNWFRAYRELYVWPSGLSRRASEGRIADLGNDLRTAIREGDAELLRSALVSVHRWKTANRQGQTRKYLATLERLGEDYYLGDLFSLAPFDPGRDAGTVVRHLKVRNCNLPVSTAIASFLYGRRAVPILDKFLSQFFARKLRHEDADEQTRQALAHTRRIDFRIEDGGGGRLRLAVYSRSGFEHGLRLFLREYVPECTRIAGELAEAGVQYAGVDGRPAQFSPVDVEMAIFSWAMRNSDLF